MSRYGRGESPGGSRSDLAFALDTDAVSAYISCHVIATPDMRSHVADRFSDLGRFAEPSLNILVSLSGSPKHGYAIMTDVEAITGSPMGPGTLYGALARLERRGMIEALEPEDRRRPYRLTALGEASVRAQLERLSGFARTGLDRLGSTTR